MQRNIVTLLNERSIGQNINRKSIPIPCWCTFMDLYKAIASEHRHLADETNLYCNLYCINASLMKCYEGNEVTDFISDLFCKYFVKGKSTKLYRFHIHNLRYKLFKNNCFLPEWIIYRQYKYEDVFFEN